MPRQFFYSCVALIAVAGLVAGCHPHPHGSSASPSQASNGKPVSPSAVAPPPGVDAQSITPLQGEALAKATLSLPEILAQLPVPDYLRPASATQPAATQPAVTTQPAAPSSADAEPPLAAQHDYVAGREALMQGHAYDAVSHFEQTLRLAPDRPEVLRLLGQIYFAGGNEVRGASYLKRAVAADPSHEQSLMMLGRFAMDQGRWGEAIVLFDRVLRRLHATASGDSDEAALAHYYLAGALSNAGYAAAAIAQQEAYLHGSADTFRGAGPSRAGRQLDLLEQQQGLSWRAVGDLYHQLDRPVKALAAYRRAATEQGDASLALTARIIYSDLRLGDRNAARQAVLETVRSRHGDDASLALVRYAAKQGVSSHALADAIKQQYGKATAPSAVVLTLAELLPADEAPALLERHLAGHPDDAAVFEALLDKWLLPKGAARASASQRAAAIRATAKVMAAQPATAGEPARELFKAADDASALLEAYRALPDEEQHRAAFLVVAGLAQLAQHQPAAAQALLQRAVKAAPSLSIARLALAQALAEQKQYDAAGKMLAPLANSSDPRVIALRVRVLWASGHTSEAIELLNDRIAHGGASVRLMLQKADLELKAGRATTAEQTLLDALNAHPREEAIYQALLQLYNPRDGSPSPVTDADQQARRVIGRLLQTIPHSRLGRLMKAELLEAKGQSAQAESILRQLLAENDKDVEAMGQLLHVLMRDHRKEEAGKLVVKMVHAHPRDAHVLGLAAAYYQQIGDKPRMLAMHERRLKAEPPGERRDTALAVLYLGTDRPKEALATLDHALAAKTVHDPVELVSLQWRVLVMLKRPQDAEQKITAAVARFPKLEKDLRYERTSLAEALGQTNKAEKLLAQLLDQYPNDAKLNNALGYHWANRGIHLDKALVMIQKAHAQDPTEAAYLDSLGWVLYKMGQFPQAVHRLQQATHARGGSYPVVINHLGDALYRAGHKSDAKAAWTQAQTLLSNFKSSLDPEMKGLADKLQAKLDAMAHDKPVTTAPLGKGS